MRNTQPDTLIKPRALQPGDTIAVVSPAGPTPYNSPQGGPDAFTQGADLLEAAGFRVKLMPNIAKKHMYLAGTDAERLADLHQAFEDPSVHGILCARGGYGSMRLLPHLDFSLIARNPKVFIGFSDITALLLPFYQRCGLVGFYGPMLTSNLVHGEPFSQSALLQLVQQPLTIPHAISNRDPYRCYRPGTAEGRLMGGNLSLLAALCGTPYQPDTRGHILFIEDWKEKYYSLDRQFQQLRLAGLFQGITGLVLCDFSEIEAEPELALPDFLRSLVDDLAIPVGYGFSVGHGEQTATLPIGCQARFNAETGQLLLLEAPTQP
jgi:muramoyltetrapeptide carboxypeptidase